MADQTQNPDPAVPVPGNPAQTPAAQPPTVNQTAAVGPIPSVIQAPVAAPVPNVIQAPVVAPVPNIIQTPSAPDLNVIQAPGAPDLTDKMQPEDLSAAWRRTKCLNCGYLYEGSATLTKCPKCGNTDPDKFQEAD
jgi:hypothetical protein